MGHLLSEESVTMTARKILALVSGLIALAGAAFFGVLLYWGYNHEMDYGDSGGAVALGFVSVFMMLGGLAVLILMSSDEPARQS